MREPQNIMPNRSERGGVIIFVMLVILSLVFLISVAIDGSRGLIEQSQIKLVADQIALAALEGYVTEPSDIHDDKYNSAVDRAAQIGIQNQSIMRGRSFVGSVAELRAGTSGTITSGRWWSARPAACGVGTCPCGAAPGTIPPCFQACPNTGVCPQVTGTDSDFANAIQVKLNTTNTNPLIGFFSNSHGQATIDVSNASGGTDLGSVAMIAPRVNLLLVDLSRRASFESDPPFFPPLPPPPAVPPPPPTRWGDPVPAADCGTYVGVTPPGFTCIQVSPTSPPIWIELSRDPQPFGIELDAANGALRSFNDFALPGDSIGMLGFSDNVTALAHPERIFTPAPKGDPGVDAMLALTLTADDPVYGTVANARNQRVLRNFIPYNSSADISGALDAARTLLETVAPSPGVEKVITLITQGVPDCNRIGTCSAPTDTTCYPAPAFGVYAPGDFVRQISQLKQIVRNCGNELFQRGNIRIDVSLAGAAARPHTLLLRSVTAAKCMDDLESRRRDYLNVRPMAPAVYPFTGEEPLWASLGTHDPTGAPAPYTLPNLFHYSMARFTRGMWIPMRPPCPVLVPPLNLNARCASYPRGPATMSPPENSFLRVILDAALLPPANVEDGDGRLLCDEARRTYVKQMRDAFDIAFTRRAFILTN